MIIYGVTKKSFIFLLSFCKVCNLKMMLFFVSVLCNVEFPFEFRALEVFLEAICSFLDARTRELETDAYPALDELTSKVMALRRPVSLASF